MAGNRYYATKPQEVFESYEWLMREKLTELDRMARRIDYDLEILSIRPADRQKMVQKFFTELWQQVAATEEAKYGKGMRRWHTAK